MVRAEVIRCGEVSCAVVESGGVLIFDGQTALDFMMSVQYETGCSSIVLNKGAIDDAFFKLRTGIAGEILQKFINYRIKLAIVGDFSGYGGTALGDFIGESNRGRDIFFVQTREQALEKLAGAQA